MQGRAPTTGRPGPRPFAIFLASLVCTLALAMGVFALLLSPGVEDLRLMALLFAGGTLLTAGLGYGVFRVGWGNLFPRLFWSLLAGYLLAGLLTFLGVWVTARLMFLDRHDLLLSGALLLFATGLAVSLGYLFAFVIGLRVELVASAARQVAGGDLRVRVPAEGRDEIAELAETFNRMTEKLAEADDRRVETEQMRRDLISWVGHDLRTPLASVRVIVEALADGMIEDRATEARYLAAARRDIDSLGRLIDDLFLLTQLDSGRYPLNLQVNSLSDLVSDTIESLSVLAEQKGVQLLGEAGAGLDSVRCDAQQLERALRNLVQNALDNSRPGGRVRVRALGTGALAKVEVIDGGSGIAPEHLPHIFEPFYRADKSRSRQEGSGAGLGLAIARRIVQAHEGEIRVRNLPDTGACFSFWIPRS